jgi:hypothetical protein
MTKRPSRKSRRTVDIVSQVRTAVANPAATLLGAVLGGVIPWFAREMLHGEVSSATDPRLIIVLGCMAFSMLTVYGFGLATFRSGWRAVGFCLAVEGVAICAATPRIWGVALLMLVAINAVATGCKIAGARGETLRRRERAAQRRQPAPVVPAPAGRQRTPGRAPEVVVDAEWSSVPVTPVTPVTSVRAMARN